MSFKIWYDEKEGILRADIFKSFTPEVAASFFKDLGKYPEEQLRYFLAGLGEDAQAIIDKETRRVSREMGSSVNWGKMAIYGAKPGLRMLAKIVVKAMGRAKETKFFETENEGLAWLKAEKEKDINEGGNK